MDKELMDCLLSDEDLIKIRDTHLQYNCPLCGLQQLIQAQLQSPKLAAYIEERVSEAVHERNTIGNEIIRAMEELAEAQVKAERAKLIRQIETISYECPYGYTHICLHKEEYETMVKQEEV